VGVADSANDVALRALPGGQISARICAPACLPFERSSPSDSENHLCGKTEFMSQIRLICPVQSRAQKYIAFVFSEFMHSSVHPVSPGGAESRSSRTLDAGSDGHGLLQCVSHRRTAGVDAEIVWSWHPDADAKPAAMIRW